MFEAAGSLFNVEGIVKCLSYTVFALRLGFPA